jgi:hypothetical protein
MTLRDQPLCTSTDPELRQRVCSALRGLAVHDWLVLAYLSILNLVLLAAPSGAARLETFLRTVALLVVEVTALIAVRGRLLTHRFSAALLYRVAVFGTVQMSYFFLADLLPLVRPGALDEPLYALDHLLFGVEPAMALDSCVNPITTEWFAFFYYCYFFVLALHVITILMFSRRERIVGEFALGMLIVFCTGHILYMVVPGFGPYRMMADEFSHALPRGMWLDTVMTTVAEGGAQKDIFPSLHTAAPTFIAMFSFRNRHLLPFRHTWAPVWFISLNIVVATMFLRWHYVIDVVAGLALAVTAWYLAVRVTAWETERRRTHRLTPNWPAF